MEPWEVEGVPWKTEAAYWSWVRGVLRAGWSRHPVKLEYIKQNRHKVKNPNPNGRVPTVWGMTCAQCKGKFPVNLNKKVKKRIEELTGEKPICIEINHKNSASSLRCKADLENFAGRLLYVTLEDLEALCQECHAIFTYAEANNLTLKEAEIFKKYIVPFKAMNASQQQEVLLAVGCIVGSNAKQRLKTYEDYIRSTKLE